jgi:hypothetical protein
MLKDRDAIPFLMHGPHNMKRVDARDLVSAQNGGWVLSWIEGQRGHPIGLLAPGKNEYGGNIPFPEPAKTQAKSEGDFRRVYYFFSAL